ncbi:unnamed protein product [Cylindrotheca closterium]|uniref:Uncharacterized protein n=1 Tax=Cylindrotheca closterium TaxID=2856 RepID=A0AAD2CR05_9STRA|nr:unnamed protein product [Cylindrotheca closterium]
MIRVLTRSNSSVSLLAGIMAVDWLLQQWFPDLRQWPRVRIACDGLLAIEMALEDRPLSPTDMQFDLVSTIREAIARTSVSWSPQYVYGHLDKTLLFEELTRWEQKNLEVHGLAVEFRKELKVNHQLIAPGFLNSQGKNSNRWMDIQTSSLRDIKSPCNSSMKDLMVLSIEYFPFPASSRLLPAGVSCFESLLNLIGKSSNMFLT